MNVDRQDIDPREVFVAKDEYESALTDNESDGEDLVKELQRLEQQRKIIEGQLKDREVAKIQHSVAGTGKEQQGAKYFEKKVEPPSNSGNAVVDSLNKSRYAEQLKKQKQAELHRSRVYTFDDDAGLEAKPQACRGDGDQVEKYSGKTLTHRYIPSTRLDTFLEDKKVLRLDKVFAKIAPPDFREPDYFNWCCVGIITKKSEPMFASGGQKAQKSNKYMKITISDFKLSLDITLFGDAFKRYWKLKVGDVIAVLNPQVFVIRNSLSKKFSTAVNAFNLSLKYDVNSILEIGKAALGSCQSQLRSGQLCGALVAPTEKHCHYHQELALKRNTAKRMELNGSFRMYDPVGENGVKQQVLMDSKSNNTVSGHMFNDPNAEKKDRYSLASKKFSSVQAAKAFFNDDSSHVKDRYLKSMRSQPEKKRTRDEYVDEEVRLTAREKNLLLRQKLKASIIKDEFAKRPKPNGGDGGNDDDDDDLDIIF